MFSLDLGRAAAGASTPRLTAARVARARDRRRDRPAAARPRARPGAAGAAGAARRCAARLAVVAVAAARGDQRRRRLASAPSSTSSSDAAPNARARVFAVLAIAFFFAPLALRAVGVHGASRSRTARWRRPRSCRRAGTCFDQATRFFVDRMPLREQAVRANTLDLARRLRHHTALRGRRLWAGAPASGAPATKQAKEPASLVVEGSDGWLYLANERDARARPSTRVTRRCDAGASW